MEPGQRKNRSRPLRSVLCQMQYTDFEESIQRGNRAIQSHAAVRQVSPQLLDPLPKSGIRAHAQMLSQTDKVEGSFCEEIVVLTTQTAHFLAPFGKYFHR